MSTKSGEHQWLYLAVVMDAASRAVVGWSMADHLRTELALDALDMTLARRDPAPGAIHHSDLGSQYLAGAYQARLHAHGLRPSAGRAGRCWDNAAVESFFATRVPLMVAWPWQTFGSRTINAS
ncbi:hypothetical protein ER308_02280 [Egibacter rhizosphaerae]|uniref:Integrase catalytic domain-containing protein n=1 Tax=Egibacter rhizosphaerae TaxID=1670831 RepID=A0A411YBD1_9ACTN|nr:DDE-type integrase/transposase/recombinase [Egibacter rhizosphaerae]QBI18510.1 hypothetical protein ER308_02280 [Egibacter rhizosphaerae]